MSVLKDSLLELSKQIKEINKLEKDKTTTIFDFILWNWDKEIYLKGNDAVHFAMFYTSFIEDSRFLKK